MEHTKRPWIRYVDEGRTVAILPAGRPGDICKITTQNTDEESEANAHLIVTAPELLEAGRQVLEAVGDSIDASSIPATAVLYALQLAIAKAEGK